MKNALIIAAVLVVIVVIAAYTHFSTLPAVDSFDTCAAAGNPIMESYPRQCAANGQTFAEESCSDTGINVLTLADAKIIAINSICGNRLKFICTCPDGYVKDGNACNPSCYYSTPRCLAPSLECQKSYVCNSGTGTYWIDLDIVQQGCAPACVINIANRTAEINYRCTGLIVPE